MWHSEETSGLGADFRAKWCPEKHRREHIPFPVQTVLRSNTLQGRSRKGSCQIWRRWDRCASLLSPAHFFRKCRQCSCYAWAVNADTSPRCPVLSAHLQLSNGFWSWGIACHTSGVPGCSVVVKFHKLSRFSSSWVSTPEYLTTNFPNPAVF